MDPFQRFSGNLSEVVKRHAIKASFRFLRSEPARDSLEFTGFRVLSVRLSLRKSGINPGNPENPGITFSRKWKPESFAVPSTRASKVHSVHPCDGTHGDTPDRMHTAVHIVGPRTST